MKGLANEAERFDWLRLIRSENVGPETFHTLIRRFGTARAALDALPDLAAAGGGRRPIAVAEPGRVERELAAAERIGAHFVYYGTAAYPALLYEIGGPPPVLAVRGDTSIASRPAIAVVGSRQASAAGRTIARTWSEAFGADGWAVVSGLALGIDAEAHRAALATGTVAVVAGGVDRPSPEANVDLCDRIAEEGAVVSEMPLGTEPFSRLFVRRNRLIAGLSRGVVVVEAAARSGALYTADFAATAGREVFAVPGSPLDPRAAGCLKLLKEGATLATEARDVLVQLSAMDAPMLPGFSEDEPLPEDAPAGAVGEVHAALSLTPVSVDTLVRLTRLPTATVIATLVELELAGHAEREPNGMVRAAVPG
ncbi:DNA-protecting protein DprA [Acuticoccus sediminis]|uniref:DNA-protecting protein DprA n=1 Tax=Acuticoccus sediminis TaxID=2184697 RepID=A0A8B2P2L0_9HYPH|nr:DNA-processing protein DprA [Acuticoccus sediminis]RAI04386.1 DNA-protecting protein DprA [Acuticoccus sediminis]